MKISNNAEAIDHLREKLADHLHDAPVSIAMGAVITLLAGGAANAIGEVRAIKLGKYLTDLLLPAAMEADVAAGIAKYR